MSLNAAMGLPTHHCGLHLCRRDQVEAVAKARMQVSAEAAVDFLAGMCKLGRGAVVGSSRHACVGDVLAGEGAG